jgi:hypothetical protein
LNRGAGGQPSYLWTRDSSSTLDPIVELRIVTTAEGDPPSGFERLGKNLLRGCESHSEAYLCFRRSRTEEPIGSVFVLYAEQTSEEDPSIQLVPEPILRSEAGVIRLCFKRADKEETKKTAQRSVVKLVQGSVLSVRADLLEERINRMHALDDAPDSKESDMFWASDLVSRV